jgi:shikimate kinase
MRWKPRQVALNGMSSNARILLIGFSGTGKTTVGRMVARELGWKFVDTDDLIVGQVGKPIEQIFEEEGEQSFRFYEQAAIVESCSGTNVVIALGGGAVTSGDNLERIQAAGFVVALEATPETIYHRLFDFPNQTGREERKTIRPLLETGDEEPLTRIKRLKLERQVAYSFANWIVNTDFLTISDSAAEIIRAWDRRKQLNVAQNDPEIAALVKTSRATYPIVVGWGILEQQLGTRLIETV